MIARVCKIGTDCDVTCFCVPCRACFDHCLCLDSLLPVVPVSSEEPVSNLGSSAGLYDGHERDTIPEE